MQNGVRISTRTFNIKIVNFMTLWSGLYARFGFYCQLMFSSPELKAQVSFSDQLSSVVCLSVHLSVIFSHVYLLLQNHWANFNQNWHKVSLGEENSCFFKWNMKNFSKGDNYEILKIHWRNLKIIFSRTTGPISTKFGTMHPWVKGIRFCSNQGLAGFSKGR